MNRLVTAYKGKIKVHRGSGAIRHAVINNRRAWLCTLQRVYGNLKRRFHLFALQGIVFIAWRSSEGLVTFWTLSLKEAHSSLHKLAGE